MSGVALTNDDLLQHLKENIGFLEVSSKAFDEGFYAEAKRLATIIRVLVHDTSSSQSLLHLLGIKSTLNFINTAYPVNPKNLMPHTGLVSMQIGSKNTYKAPLEGRLGSSEITQEKPFDSWWNEVVIIDSFRKEFTRKSLVLTLVNKDGGAHVDPVLKSDYADLKKNNSVGWAVTIGEESFPLLEVELHSVRQIAFELHETLSRAGYNA
ncbi:hypothetical protein NQ683_17405 [Acinetobacter baumannii]|uniref:hypothetical protein n=1 Tax=Acinetobacter calcoaceticus/baumannii complex TaxID=909768 RepID=UPI0004DB75C9|nr:hypothetical protein [Acinetobacter baumannii]MDC4422556.1 hypothetical protein [Acinetobacter baumannii]MDV7458240.1 hypothetical protein [Acinetobacter baumannii]